MSNPDRDFPDDLDRFTPDQDTPNLQDPEVMPDPVTDQHLKTWAQQEEERLLSWSRLPQEQKVRFLERWWEEARQAAAPAWARQVEQESVAGPVERPFSPPWPPLSRAQVVELHEALSAWMESVRLDGSMPSRLRDHALHSALTSLNIGTPQPTAPKPEVKRNCWTCGHKGDHCLSPGANMNSPLLDWLYGGVPFKDRLFPPSANWEKAGPCPGWTPKS